MRDEPGADEVAALLRSDECVTPSSCLAEVVDHLIRLRGVAPEEIVDHLEPLVQSALGVVAIENRLGWQGGELRGIHYEHKNASLSLADCLLLASVGPNDRLASSDRALIAAARELDIGVIPLPDSRGRRPKT